MEMGGEGKASVLTLTRNSLGEGDVPIGVQVEILSGSGIGGEVALGKGVVEGVVIERFVFFLSFFLLLLLVGWFVFFFEVMTRLLFLHQKKR